METKETKIPEAKKAEVAKPTPKPVLEKKAKNPNEGLTFRQGRGAEWWEDADGNIVERD